MLSGEPALGDQLGVGVGHGVTGDAKVGGQRTRRRQPGAGRQTPRAHGLPQGVHQPGAQPPGPGQVQMQVDTDLGPLGGRRSGPVIRHRNGPYPYATWRVAFRACPVQDHLTKEYHHANQTDPRHTAVGGGSCRGSDPRRTDGRGRSQPLQQTCIATGAGTTCQSPGNVEITNAPPAVSFYPYGTMPWLLGGH